MSQRLLVLGGAGFVGSHLCDRLLERGDAVVCVDDFSTGRRSNIAHLDGEDGFSLVEADISVALPVDGRVDGVLHLASPASPPDYLARPLETLQVGSEGPEGLSSSLSDREPGFSSRRPAKSTETHTYTPRSSRTGET